MEILYFLNENSYVDGLHIKNIRKHLGRKFAEKEDVLSVGEYYGDFTVIVIPLTGICYGKEYALEMGYKYEQLIKLGFRNVYIYPGGMFEWLCLQDIYSNDLYL